MQKEEVFRILKDVGVVPVVRAEAAEDVLLVVEALVEGGLPVAEITLTVSEAVQAIRACAARFGNRLVLGAGSVTDPRQCPEVIEAGCLFVVTPVFKPEVVDRCRREGVGVICGALTPSEIVSAWEVGADAVKVFPVKALGGASYLQMVHEPLPQIPLVPTGGVTLETLEEYFRAGAPFVGVGGDLVDRRSVQRGDRAALAARARRYVEAVRTVRERLATA